MIETIRRLLDFSGRCRTDLLCASGYGVLYSVSEVIPVLAIVVALEAVLSPSGGGWFAVAASGGLMGLSVAGKIIFGKRATERRMLASYDMCADKRIEVGEILKRVPLGYFSQNRLGELTATLTTTLGEIETNAVAILDKVANGFVHAVAITLLISWYDWHAGLITAACQWYHEISRVMATACTKPFATLSRIATALVSISPSVVVSVAVQLAEPILAEIAERHAPEDFPHFDALVRAHIVSWRAYGVPWHRLSEYDFAGDSSEPVSPHRTRQRRTGHRRTGSGAASSATTMASTGMTSETEYSTP